MVRVREVAIMFAIAVLFTFMLIAAVLEPICDHTENSNQKSKAVTEAP